MKGSQSTYRPVAGTRCLLSGPNEDNEQGYVFGETTILWRNDTFVLYGNAGCWPVLNKWEHVIAKPLEVDSGRDSQPTGLASKQMTVGEYSEMAGGYPVICGERRVATEERDELLRLWLKAYGVEGSDGGLSHRTRLVLKVSDCLGGLCEVKNGKQLYCAKHWNELPEKTNDKPAGDDR